MAIISIALYVLFLRLVLGPTPGRNVRSWRERIEMLQELGFIGVQPNGSRKYGYILLLHPHRVVCELRARGKVNDPWWGAFSKRASEIGATLPIV